MNILLAAVNAKYIHSNPALYSLKAYAGDELEPYLSIAEYTINNRIEEILADLYKRKPDMIAFSCYIWNWTLIQELLSEIPKILPRTRLWLGGPEVSFDGGLILQRFPQLDGIMIGEGEVTFKELASHYCLGKPKYLEEIKGLNLRAGLTAEREMTDMSSVPFLYQNLEPFSNRIIYYESSRGCPYRCSYCLSSIEKTVRFRDLEIVKRELEFFLREKIPQVKFVDRTFNCNHHHAMEIWKYILENDNGITNFHFEISADILRQEEIDILNKMRPGLVQLEIGVQSTNPHTLQDIRRQMDVEKLKEIVQKLRAGNNIHIHLDLIAGLPREDYISFSNSFNEVFEMEPEQLQLGFLKVLKGSHMQKMAEEYGLRYLDKPPYEVLCSKWIDYGEILKLKQIEEMVEIYYNSNQYTYTLPVLISNYSTPFQFFEELAHFYDRNDYFTNNPARSYRYEVLLQFACLIDQEREALYKELLTFDMYLRENLKSRPSFAKEISEQKEAIRNFYTKEEKERYYLPGYLGQDSRQLSKMTHLEHFQYAVWEKGLNVIKGTPGFVLFDYQVRNPLTREAEITVITDCEED